jgi:nucleoside triphosphate diphosphatase
MAQLRDPDHGCPWDRQQTFADDIVTGITRKLIRRHPYVFKNKALSTAETEAMTWETHKALERRMKSESEDTSALTGVSLALPAVTRALKLQHRAARVGFDWNHIGPVLDKVEEELQEVRQALADKAPCLPEEIGDLLFACINLARFTGVDPEAALRRTNAKFEQRFRFIETRLAEQGRTLEEASLAEMDSLWEQAKRFEQSGQARNIVLQNKIMAWSNILRSRVTLRGRYSAIRL